MFLRFVLSMAVLLALFGLTTGAVAIWGDVRLATRMVSVFGTMFTALLGFGSGYLIGSRTEGTPGG
jgi:hypothetical protein